MPALPSSSQTEQHIRFLFLAVGIIMTRNTKAAVEPNNQEQAAAINRSCWNVRNRKLVTTSPPRRRSIISQEAKRPRRSFYFHHVILKYINPSLLALVMSKYQPSPDALFEKNTVPLRCFLVGIILYGAVECIATRNHRYFDLLSRFALSLAILTTVSLVSMLVVNKKHVPVVPFAISTLSPLILLVCWPALRSAYNWLLGKIKHKILLVEKLVVWLKRGEERASSVLV